MAEQRRVITLITDYGEKGPFAGALKGAILNINPDAQVVDITHSVSSGDILEAGFILSCAYRYYPVGTIHVVVVDPKVGSYRLALLISTENHYFLAPDNGVLSYIFAREEIYNAVSLTEDHFFLKPTSHTFHGRDIFAPVAAHISLGVPLNELGQPIASVNVFPLPRPQTDAGGSLVGHILHIDHFGNLITDITSEDLPSGGYSIQVAGHQIGSLSDSYEQRHELLALIGSSGRLEIALKGGHAARLLGSKLGDELQITRCRAGRNRG